MVSTTAVRGCFFWAPAPIASRQQPLAANASRLMGSSMRASATVRAPKRTVAGSRNIVKAAVTPQELDQKLDVLIQEAKDLCASGTAGECAAMWDAIEEISAEASHKKAREQDGSDPLENFCEDNPETDECRTYEY